MRHRTNSPRADGLLPLGVADALWADLLADSALPPASCAFTCYPTHPQAGYVLLGSRAVPTVRTSGRWHVSEAEVRQAATELRSVEVNTDDLVRVAPFRRSARRDQEDWLALRWRPHVGWEWDRLHDRADRPEAQQRDSDLLQHLVGIDWRRTLIEATCGKTTEWWLPRALTNVLDAAERTEKTWLRTARTCQGCGAVSRQSWQWRVQRRTGWQTICPDCRTATLRPYAGELEGQLYSAVSKRPRTAVEVSRWMCAVCLKKPAFALDHCHEHGYVRAPVCQSCNVRERPAHVYSNEVVAGPSYSTLLAGGAQHWLTHWHRCAGCRSRNTLPLPHLAAVTALLGVQSR